MWRRRAKRAAIIAAAVLAVIAAILVWLWRDRPDLDSIGWPAPAVASAFALRRWSPAACSAAQYSRQASPLRGASW